ncbi:hypothetical protein, partial [Aureimonas sp. AU4]|uniref:hypothetical protein n=1 Tax=Aureimonas sp. AU4 TaxID=1638163 RepID=UPI001AEC20C0
MRDKSPPEGCQRAAPACAGPQNTAKPGLSGTWNPLEAVHRLPSNFPLYREAFGMNLKLSLRLAASVAALAALSCGSALAQ